MCTNIIGLYKSVAMKDEEENKKTKKRGRRRRRMRERRRRRRRLRLGKDEFVRPFKEGEPLLRDC